MATTRLFDTLGQLVLNLGDLAVVMFTLILNNALLLVWIAWWLWGVDWSKLWPMLGRGAWAPFTLLALVAALVWSRLAPSECSCLGFAVVPNFWWQLGAVALLLAFTFFLGWLQGVLSWAPAEIQIEPAPAAHDDHHGHAAHH